MVCASSLWVLGIFTRLALSYEAVYWYSSIKDACQYNKVSMTANDNSGHGAVCAYSPDTVRIYACPAPDPYCWTGTQNCKGGSNKAGKDQILCDNYNTQWCCTADETCTVTTGQVNVCISNFTSPNAKVGLSDANKKALAALDLSSITATSQKANPTPFSTQTFYSTDSPVSPTSSLSSSTSSSISTSSATTSSRSTSSTSHRSGSQTPSSTTDTSNPTASPTAASETPVSVPYPKSGNSEPGISSGAIAGIVIGVVLFVSMIAGAFFSLGRKKLRKAGVGSAGPTYPPPKYAYSSLPNERGTMSTVYTGYYERKPGQPADRVEMPPHGYGGRSELSSSDGPPQRYELGQ